MFESFTSKFKILFKNPMSLFIYSIMSKWYISIFLAGIVVAYWTFKGLSDAGVLQNAQQTIFKALGETKAVAKFCVPKITNIGNFWDCIQNPPTYTPSKDELILEENLHRASDSLNYDSTPDPYATDTK